MDDLLSHSSNISGSVAPDNLWRDDSLLMSDNDKKRLQPLLTCDDWNLLCYTKTIQVKLKERNVWTTVVCGSHAPFR